MHLGDMEHDTKELSDTSDDRLLSRREVEERFGISKRFLEIAVSRQVGPRIVRIGRSVRYRASDLRTWIEEQADPQ